MLFWASALVILSFYGTSAKLSDYFAILPENYLARANVEATTSSLNVNESYCYHFTWMGRSFDNRTFGFIENKTCEEYHSENDIKPAPLCVDPMVATWYGGEPDIDYIYEHYASEGTGAFCRLTEDRVCAKYSVYFNGILTNVTRYCTRINVAFESSMESGCVSEQRGVYTFEVCACKSSPGKICNSSHRSLISYNLLILFFTIIYLYSIRRGCSNIQ